MATPAQLLADQAVKRNISQKAKQVDTPLVTPTQGPNNTIIIDKTTPPKPKVDTTLVLGTPENQKVVGNIGSTGTGSTPGSVSQGPKTPVSPIANEGTGKRETPLSVESGKGLKVIKYKDNPNGTTTNLLSDGSSDTISQKTPNTAPNYSESVKDTNNYLGTGLNIDQFNTLSLEDQKRYVDQAGANEQQKKDLYDQAKYVEESKRQSDYMNQQKSIQDKTTALQNENQAIKDSQVIRQEQTNLANLKQNIGFLGTGGRAVQSQGMLDSYDRTLTEANTTYNEIVKIQENVKSMRDLGIEFDANAYEEKVRQLNKDLTDKIDSVLLGAINDFSADQISGMIDSPQKLYQLQQKYLDGIDTSVAGLTNRSIQNLQAMSEGYKTKIAQAQEDYKLYQEQQATFQKNANTLNKDMSSVLGYYVDGNGQPIVSNSGQAIPFRKDMPAPIFDKERGIMVTFEPDVNGNPVGVTQQIMPVSQAYEMDLAMKQAQIEKLRNEQNFSDKTIKVQNADGTESTKQYNVKTGRYDIDITGSSPISQNISNPQTLQEITDFCLSNRGKNTVQCGMLVNDYIKMATGSKGGLGNSFDSKVTAMSNLGLSEAPVEGGVFAFPVKTFGGNTGHTGIVTKVNEDGSIEVLEANRVENSKNGGVPRMGRYSAEQVANLNFQFSLPPKGNQQASQPDSNKFPQYKNYIETGKLPTGMKDGTANAIKFVNEASQGYISGMEKVANQSGLTITNPQAFLNVDDKVRDKVNAGLQTMPAFESTMNKLIALTKENGTEIIPSNTRKQMQQLVKDAQLQAKEIYNLGVLNGPDLSLMESIIVNPTTLGSSLESINVDFVKALEDGRNTVLSKGYELAKQVGLQPVSGKKDTNIVNQNNTQEQTPTQQQDTGGATEEENLYNQFF